MDTALKCPVLFSILPVFFFLTIYKLGYNNPQKIADHLLGGHSRCTKVEANSILTKPVLLGTKSFCTLDTYNY